MNRRASKQAGSPVFLFTMAAIRQALGPLLLPSSKGYGASFARLVSIVSS